MEVMRRIGLDTNVFMAVFLDESNRVEASATLLRLIMNGTIESVVGSITLVEIATLFMQRGEDQKARKALGLVRNLPNTTIVDLTPDMALNIAELKVSEKLSIADAAVLAAATELHADAFVTYDEDFKKVKRIPCMRPDTYLLSLGESEKADE